MPINNENAQGFKVNHRVCNYGLKSGTIIQIIDKENSFNYSNDCIVEFDDKTKHEMKFSQLRHGAWEENFGNLPNIKPYVLSKKYLNAFVDEFGNSEYKEHDSEIEAMADYNRLIKDDPTITFHVVAQPVLFHERG